MGLTVEEAWRWTNRSEAGDRRSQSYFDPRRGGGKRGRGAGGKKPVIDLLKRGGKVFTEIVENCSKQALMARVLGSLERV
jgi:hypothetical protein